MQYAMMPIVLASSDPEKAERFIQKYIEDHALAPYHIHTFQPEGKEFSILQVRDLKKQIRFTNNNTQLFILNNFSSASIEAQNALLKTLEEHQKETMFILVVSSANAVLPTISSRAKIIDLDRQNNKNIAPITISKEIDKLITGDVSVLGSPLFYVKKNDDPLRIFDELVASLRARLAVHPALARVLKNTLYVRYGVQHNNIDAQNALDNVIIQIYQACHT